MAQIFFGLADTVPYWRVPVAMALIILVWQLAEFIGSIYFDDE